MLGPVEPLPESTICHEDHVFDQCGCPVPGSDAGGYANGGSGGEGGSAANDHAGEGGSGAESAIQHCAPGQRCIVRYVSRQDVGFVGYMNRCENVCLTNEECPPPELCWAGVCHEPECVRDSDCNRGEHCGHCTFRRELGDNAEPIVTPSSTCVYEGACVEDSCFGCEDKSQEYGEDAHVCWTPD
jgi:hypothetical protein